MTRAHSAVFNAVMIPACAVMFGMPVVLVVAGMLRVMEWLA
jgi:hypothetical protein